MRPIMGLTVVCLRLHCWVWRVIMKLSLVLIRPISLQRKWNTFPELRGPEAALVCHLWWPRRGRTDGEGWRWPNGLETITRYKSLSSSKSVITGSWSACLSKRSFLFHFFMQSPPPPREFRNKNTRVLLAAFGGWGRQHCSECGRATEEQR